MRTTFVQTLSEIAEKDERIFLITGDLGFSVFEPFQKKFPKRFLNMGVAEQNMIGVSAGLALSGKVVFVYSIVPFLTLRCLEQIRNDICYHDLNVKLVGVGGGFSYGVNGCTHYSLEDISILKSLHGMSVICPGDPREVEGSIRAVVKSNHPYYIRLGKNGEPLIHPKSFQFEIGKAITLNEGSDITLITTGNMLENTKTAAQILEKQGLSVRLISMHTIKPLDTETVLKAMYETKAIFTIEEHSEIGGLGSSIADILACYPHPGVLFKKIGTPDTFSKTIGRHEYLRQKFGLSSEQISSRVIGHLDITKNENIHYRSIFRNRENNNPISG